MNPRALHQKAMDLSFRAKQASIKQDANTAYDLFCKAAELESEVARFYFDKPEHEPTRSVLIRSAAFLNLKAGQIEIAREFIFFGLLNLKDESIKEQLEDALEIVVSLKDMNTFQASNEYNYLNALRQRSIHYVLEPSSPSYGSSVSLDMIRDFSTNFLKSLKSYASTTFKNIKDLDYSDLAAKEFEKIVNPLVTNSSYGSFKFSISNDFLSRPGEDEKVLKLKSTILDKYHNNIFTNSLNDDDIKALKEGYTSEEIALIFKPLARIKSINSPYKIGYYDSETFNKTFISKIANNQKKKLIPLNIIDRSQIGKLENSIIHTKESSTGKVSKKTILKEELKLYEFDKIIKEICSKDFPSIILNQEVIINVHFSSDSGFTLVTSDFDLESIHVEYEKGLEHLHTLIFNKIVRLQKKKIKNDFEESEWKHIRTLINDPNSISND